ncbi:MAG: signal recognition particle-docking protein FtsY [Myxococcales bacterium]|nr:signal recognition particle-docking protein FtsY [Myxococcales bacterium]
MDMTIVLVGVLVLVAIGFLLTRKKPALPESTEASKAPLPASNKSVPTRDAEAPASIKAKPEPIDLPSADVLPAADSLPKAEVPAPAKARPRDVAGLRKGLALSRGGFIARLTALVTGKKEIDPAIIEQLEEVLLTSDVGVKTTHTILERLKDGLKKNELADSDAVWSALRAEALRILSLDGGPLRFPAKPTVVLMVGVNGVGKTTTIGKLATRFHGEGRSIVLGAGDTFRAAAVQQLEVWGKRVGVDVVRGKEGADPGSVAFDAATKATEKGADLLLHDTAGRLHTKAPLMDEIKKVRKSIAKALDGAPHETLLVLDATTGQNALTQAAMFKEALDITGIVLTKLDGTAKGGIVLAICDELKLPVRYIGLGERAEDLREFYPEDFVEALFGKEDEVAAA